LAAAARARVEADFELGRNSAHLRAVAWDRVRSETFVYPAA